MKIKENILSKVNKIDCVMCKGRLLNFTFAFVLLLCVQIIGVRAANFEVKSPRVVGSTERFRVEFVVTDAKGDSFQAPDFVGLDVLAGPSVSSGTFINIVNGKKTKTTTQTFTYVVVPQSGVSEARITPASVVLDGKTHATNSLVIEVVDEMSSSAQSSNSGRGTQSQRGGAAAGNSARSGSAKSTLAADDIVLRLMVDKSNVYVGEAITVSLKLYSRVGISGLDAPKYPAFSGFWVQELQLGQSEVERENLNGKIYESQIIRQWLIFPQRSGQVNIESAEFDALAQVVNYNSSGTGNSLFDEFFGGGPSLETVRRKISSAAVKVNVRELPQPQPSGFDGAVGDFRASSEISSSSIQANSAGYVKFNLEGTGNFPLINTPVMANSDSSIELYDPKLTEQVQYSASGARGSMSWEFPFIPRGQGQYEISSPNFVYFNPRTSHYENLPGNTWTIDVGADASGGVTMSKGSLGADLKILGQDIRFIKASAYRGSMSWFIVSVWFYVVVLLQVVLLIFAIIMYRRINGRRQDVVGMRNKKAQKVAVNRLKMAKKFMIQGNRTEFVRQVLSSVTGYIGDKLRLPISELNRDNISSVLESKGVDNVLIIKLSELLDDLEMAQYLSSQDQSMDQLYDKAVGVITELDKSL